MALYARSRGISEWGGALRHKNKGQLRSAIPYIVDVLTNLVFGSMRPNPYMDKIEFTAIVGDDVGVVPSENH